MPFITLLTDFGLKDGYVGIMKGVIWGICPSAQIADLTHNIPPQNVMDGARALARALPYFPARTVHLAVVDPGVGTSRRPIAARLGKQFFVGPDNGLFSVILQRAEEKGEYIEVVHLNRPAFWLTEVSNVFHGRDVFAPCAAHLASGVRLREMGDAIQDFVRLPLVQPKATPQGWLGQVTHIDHFGNLSTNISAADLEGAASVKVEVGGQVVQGLARAFGDGAPGDLLALIDSSGFLSICVVNGSAAERLGARNGDAVLAALAGSQRKTPTA